MTASGRRQTPLEVLHNHDCPFYPPGVCPEKAAAQRALDALAAAGYVLTPEEEAADDW